MELGDLSGHNLVKSPTRLPKELNVVIPEEGPEDLQKSSSLRNPAGNNSDSGPNVMGEHEDVTFGLKQIANLFKPQENAQVDASSPELDQCCEQIEQYLRMPEINLIIENRELHKYLDNQLVQDSDRPGRQGGSRNSLSTVSINLPSLLDKYSKNKLISAVLKENYINKVEKKNKLKNSQNERNKMRILGAILSITQNDRKGLLNYLPILIYLANILDHKQQEQQLISSLNVLKPQGLSVSNTSDLLSDTNFLRSLMTHSLNYGEISVFRLALADTKDVTELLTDNILEEMTSFANAAKCFPMFFEACQTQFEKAQLSTQQIAEYQANIEKFGGQFSSNDKGKAGLTVSKLVMLIKYALLNLPKAEKIWEFLEVLKLPLELRVDILCSTHEETQEVDLLELYPQVKDHISIQNIHKFRMYQLLLLHDPMSLIEIFNTLLTEDPKNPKKQTPLYDIMCKLIGEGQYVEKICNVIIYVNETFWDHAKLNKFFKSLSQTLMSKTSDWLIYIQNPLLFSITLVYFFKKVKLQLDFKEKDIEDLSNMMLNFCKEYIENASEEVLNINLADMDGTDKGFLDYAFLVQDMNILSSDPIEDRIYEMWDLGRHTKQPLLDFMRIIGINNQIKKFDFGVFKENYSVEIEPTDEFQLDYPLVSSSVLMKVMSELFWPTLVVVLEFIFSMQIIQIHLYEVTHDSDWLDFYITEHKLTFYALILVRASFTLSCVIRTLAISKIYSSTHHLQVFYNLCIMISVFQGVIYPLFMWNNFMPLNISQMFFVLTVLVYVLFNALSLNDYGVLLRIFANMSFVVLVFGTASVVVISLIGYTIHCIYLPFSQPIDGQIYKDLNLFDSIYQGICTLYEFVFGAVVFVRPFIEENLYTYSISLVMIVFSFFGNIMMANMLVAFLTSQFDNITINAKYLTMNMQFELIKVFRPQETDTLISLPFILTIPAIPVYLCMMFEGDLRTSANNLLRKVIHTMNVFLPVFLFYTVGLLLLLPIRYIQQLLKLLWPSVTTRLGLLHLLSWIAFGVPFLLKLYVLDLLTVSKVVLNFSKNSDNLNYSLALEAKENLVIAFGKISRVLEGIKKDQARSKEKSTTAQVVMERMASQMIMDALVGQVQGNPTAKPWHQPESPGKNDDRLEPRLSEDKIYTTDEISKLNFNQKYQIPDKYLIPILLKKYASFDPINPTLSEMVLDVNFMLEKFKNNINEEKVSRLIALEVQPLQNARNAAKTMVAGEDSASDYSKIFNTVASLEANISMALDKLRTLRGGKE